MTNRRIEAVEKMKSQYPTGSDFVVQEYIPEFANGSLYRVGYKSENGELLENYVHFTGNESQIYAHARDALQEAARVYQPQSTIERILFSLLRVGGLSGIIAIIITLTICYLAINPVNASQPEIPEFLKNALSIILGFYFGASIYEANKGKEG